MADFYVIIYSYTLREKMSKYGPEKVGIWKFFTQWDCIKSLVSRLRTDLLTPLKLSS